MEERKIDIAWKKAPEGFIPMMLRVIQGFCDVLNKEKVAPEHIGCMLGYFIAQMFSNLDSEYNGRSLKEAGINMDIIKEGVLQILKEQGWTEGSVN